MRKAINPGRNEKNIRFGYVYVVFTALVILAVMSIINPIPAKATEETLPTYNVGDEVQLNSDYWNVRTAPSIYSELNYSMKDETVFVILEVEDDFWYKIREVNTNYEEAYIQISPDNAQYFACYKRSDNEQITTTEIIITEPETTVTTTVEDTITNPETTTTTSSEVTTTTTTETTIMTTTIIEEGMTTTAITNNNVQIGTLLKFNGSECYIYNAPYSDFCIGKMYNGEEIIILTDFASPCYGAVIKSMNRIVWIVISDEDYQKYFTPIDLSSMFTTPATTTTTSQTTTTTETTTITTTENITTYKVGTRLRLDYYYWNIRTKPNAAIAYQLNRNEEFVIIEQEPNYWYKLSNERYIQIVPSCMQYFIVVNESTSTTVITDSIVVTSTVTTTTNLTTTTPINSGKVGKKIKFKANSWYLYKYKGSVMNSDILHSNEEFFIIDDKSDPWLYIQRVADGSNAWILLTENNYRKFFCEMSG